MKLKLSILAALVCATVARASVEVPATEAATEIADGTIVNADVNASAAIAATKVHDGSVDNTEFGYLNGVTSAIQTQLTGKIADPGSVTDDAVVRWDGTGGATVQDSLVTVSDTGAIAGATDVTMSGVLTLDSTIFLDNKGTASVWLGDTQNTGLTTAAGTVAIGSQACDLLTSGDNNLCAGRESLLGVTNGSSNMGLGAYALRQCGSCSSNVGVGLEAGYNQTSNDGIFIGRGAGYNHSALGPTFIGRNAGVNSTSGTYGVAIGYGSGASITTGEGWTFLGADTTGAADTDFSIALGKGSTVTSDNTMGVGSDGAPVPTYFLGEGEESASPSNVVVQPTKAVGTDIAAGNMTIAGGRGTGSGAGGEIILQTAPTGSTGTTLGTLADRLAVGNDGGLEYFEQSAPGTPASGRVTTYAKTDGVLYYKDDAGSETRVDEPTGAPAQVGLSAPNNVIDVTEAGGIVLAAESAWFTLAWTGGWDGEGSVEVDITANPQITAGTRPGQLLFIQNPGSFDGIKIENGNGVRLTTTPCWLRDSASLLLIWDGSVWHELSRHACAAT